ncbi:MAG: phosphodiester glycosidase family protein [Pedobacter sp.]|uniref:phosphodiester glycosidase family protein n=1 Tax=Pedobacter sp. TaxID=1411316 RepID=UPI0035620036
MLEIKNLRKGILFHIITFSITFSVLAQDKDSVLFVNATFESQKIARGIVWKNHNFQNNELFGTNQNINILEVKPRKRNHFFIGFEEIELKPVSEFGNRSGAIAGINGTFFDVKKGGSIDYIRVDGKVETENRLSSVGKRDQKHQVAAVVINKGKISIQKWDGSEDWEQRLKGEDIMLSGPLLFLRGKQEDLDSSKFALARHPRTAIVQTKNKRILLITVDGRNENSAGMSLFELSKIMKWLNANDGINLDGGGSTTFWLKGQPDNGVVNYPTDNKKWDHKGERKVANAILLGKPKK